MYHVVRQPDAGGFLERSEAWLLQQEDRNNIVLSLAYAGARPGGQPRDAFYATVEKAGRLAGCVLRTPPFKLLVTDMPVAAAPAVAAAVDDAYDDLPAVLGPTEVAEAIATAWVDLNGGRWRTGMRQRIYRVDGVVPPERVAGGLRPATYADIDTGLEWSTSFARDTGVLPALSAAAIRRWIEEQELFFWHDAGPVSMARACGRTPKGVRVGYVYTPPERRGRGYASACVAALSHRLLQGGASWCMLYTDLANPTSNAIYQRIGYQPLCDVDDVEIEPGVGA